MEKQKQDNKAIDSELLEGDKPPSFVMELLTVKDKIKELICNYENGKQYCDINALYWHNCIVKDLNSLLEV